MQSQRQNPPREQRSPTRQAMTVTPAAYGQMMNEQVRDGTTTGDGEAMPPLPSLVE